MIDIRNITHMYGGKAALRDVSFTAGEGEVVGLVGPNGAGKTTLMKIITTLLEPSMGNVLVDGMDTVLEPQFVRSTVGYLPERASLYPDLLAWEYLDLFAEIAAVSAAERRECVKTALEAAGLVEKRENLTAELSKGERQRLAIQATLFHNPKALILDEPTDGLDPDSREKVLRDVRSLAGAGKAVLLSSHVLEEIEQFSDRVVILVDGQVVREKGEDVKRFSLKVRGSLEAAKELLACREDIRSASLEGERIVIGLAPGAQDASQAVCALITAGFSLIELKEEGTSLRARFHRAVEARKDQG